MKTDVFVRGRDSVTIPIKDAAFSKQSDDILEKWRELLNILIEIGEIPAALVMRLLEGEIEVHASSTNPDNVYEEGAKEHLGCGLYCETVVANREDLSIVDALKDPLWADNPDVPLGMIAYYGVPLLWPDGSIFGTLCILDSKENKFSDKIKRLVNGFRTAIEADLDHYRKENDYIDLQRRIQKELEENVKRAESANLAKNDFLSVISHELRTPLNPIIGLSEILALDEKDLEKRKALETIHDSGAHLLSLISEILDFSKLERGEFRIEETTFELSAFLNSIVKIMKPKADFERLELKLTEAPGLPETIKTDALRLRQLLINLINNALKFTEEGSVTVGVQINENGLDFSVTDTGIGIEADKQMKIFEPFYQIESSLSRHHEGAGLGLTICRKICDLIGASISMKSTPDKGSTFLISLPNCIHDLSEEAQT
ncbi:ATP-binding protein [Coraliomargarita sinensis]|uniref:sensor histidine kinase n=1 Tax=Coraliomargarita sinensis TaxID=2174842 RepID=UPI0011B3AAAE|nr:ATP-binding protein [Coraliomargarita sinensis]